MGVPRAVPHDAKVPVALSPKQDCLSTDAPVPARPSGKGASMISQGTSNGIVWATRICFALVFAINVQCAVQFVANPAGFMGGFGLSGPEGQLAVAGLGVAFLMWNATYPLFIWQPTRFVVLGGVILAQQVIGLAGETALYLQLGSFAAVAGPAILRFICFDGAGLVLMGTAFAAFCKSRKTNPSHAEDT